MNARISRSGGVAREGGSDGGILHEDWDCGMTQARAAVSGSARFAGDSAGSWQDCLFVVLVMPLEGAPLGPVTAASSGRERRIDGCLRLPRRLSGWGEVPRRCVVG
jgi:hypothetical protein